mgnify:CR=1 FL=1
MDSVRFLIADDHELIRRGLSELIREQPGWEVCATASDGSEALRLAREVNPDIVVIDISMPKLNGLEAARQILRDAPNTRVIVLSMHYSEELLHEIFALGALGYVLKSDAGRDLVAAVDSFRRGKRFVTPSLTDGLVDGYMPATSDSPPAPSPLQSLTTREREVLTRIALGDSNKDIASQLAVSVKTVETHRSRIVTKLRASSVSDLVRYAIPQSPDRTLTLRGSSQNIVHLRTIPPKIGISDQ